MPEAMSSAIAQVVAQVPGICEAYLPQCFIQGEKEARQILVIGVEKEEKIPDIMEQLMPKMKSLLPPNNFIDMLPYECGDLPEEARVQKCRIFGSPKKPWWKIW